MVVLAEADARARDGGPREGAARCRRQARPEGDPAGGGQRGSHAVGEEWRRLRQEAINRYFIAPVTEKPQLLDTEIERLAALRDLMIALNPNADPDEPPWMPRERGRGRRGRGDDPNATPPDEAARKAEADRRAIAQRYEEALAAHAKARGVALPTFR